MFVHYTSILETRRMKNKIMSNEFLNPKQHDCHDKNIKILLILKEYPVYFNHSCEIR